MDQFTRGFLKRAEEAQQQEQLTKAQQSLPKWFKGNSLSKRPKDIISNRPVLTPKEIQDNTNTFMNRLKQNKGSTLRG